MTDDRKLSVTREEQVRAQRLLSQYYAQSQSRGDRWELMSRSTIAKIGRLHYPKTYAGTAGTTADEDALGNWETHIARLRFFNPEEYLVRSHQQLMMDATILNMGSARWFGEGLPVYRLGHRRAASYMATTVPLEMAEHVKPPFRAFYIELPEGLIHFTDASGTFAPAVGVLVHVVTQLQEIQTPSDVTPPGDYWRWMCISRSAMTLWEMNRTVEHLIAGTVLPEDEYYGIGLELDAHDNRIRTLVKRLIISMCLSLCAGKELKHKTEVWSREGKKAEKGPNFNVYIDPSEVEFDARPYLKAFLSGDRRSPDYQQTVTGHWKSQPYGPRSSLRKIIEILPYKRLDHLPERPSA